MKTTSAEKHQNKNFASQNSENKFIKTKKYVLFVWMEPQKQFAILLSLSMNF